MKIFPFNLQRFSEGATAASATGAQGNGAQGVNANVTEKGGTDSQAANGGANSGIADDRATRYKASKAEFEDFYKKDVENQIKRRLTGFNVLKAKAAEQEEFINFLGARYGVNDVKSLKTAIEADDEFWQSAADKADMTVEQYKNHLLTNLRANEQKRKYDELKREVDAKNQYDEWLNQARQVKEEYPDFDLDTELENDKFRSMLSAKYSGFMPSMKQIYEIIHHDEILSNVKQSTKKTVTDNIRARGLRTDEAGSANSSGIGFKKNVRELSKEERAKLAHEASLGKTITF